MIDLNLFFKNYRKYRIDYPELRSGQSYFNVLYDMNPELANEIRGTNIDPFHKKDGDMVPFIVWLHNKAAQKKDKL